MEERIEKLEGRVTNIERDYNTTDKVVAVISTKLDNIIQSLDKLSLQYEKNVSEVNMKYDKLESKVEKLQEELNDKTTGKDAGRFNVIITAVITGIVGMVLGLIFK